MVMLLMAVAATIGLSIATRSTSQVSVSTTQDESARALEAAEIGVEQALGGEVPTGSPKTIDVDTVTKTYTTNTGINAKKQFTWPYMLPSGDAAYVPLEGYNKNLRICFGNGSGTTPAIEITTYYEVAGVMNTYITAFDPTSRTATNGFRSAGGCPSVPGLSYGTGMLQMTGGPNPLAPGATYTKFMRIRMLYNNQPQPLAIDGNSNDVPVVANEIISTGQSGMATQKIHVTQMEPDYPDMFGAALFSGSQIVKDVCPTCP